MMLAAGAVWGEARADVLDEVVERGIIRLGVRADAPPFSYQDAAGAPQGLAVALCREVARKIGSGLGLEYVTVTAAERFPALAEGRTDLHCGPASATLTRRENLDFSILYFVDGAALATRPGGYEALFEAREGAIGYLKSTTAGPVAKDLVTRNNIDATWQTFTSHVAGLRALADGAIDMYVGDQAILVFQVDALGLADEITVREDLLSFEPYALVLRRGEAGLRLAVDRALSQIYESGRIYDLIDDSLGDFPLPDGANAIYQIVALPE
jgi:polar amino acid transport system substrate-binding protein/glutamate/aspartate transport system substrate-binding protein